jgi:hypothetical protein
MHWVSVLLPHTFAVPMLSTLSAHTHPRLRTRRDMRLGINTHPHVPGMIQHLAANTP